MDLPMAILQLALMATLLCAMTHRMALGLKITHRTRRSVGTDPSATVFDDDCPNGYIAYEKFSITTGVFDCAIKTAEICHALCQMVGGPNWDITNTVGLQDTEDRDRWYCRSLPGYPTKTCYFKPKADILGDVERMHD